MTINNMSWEERINIFNLFFDDLQKTNSRIEKEAIVNKFKFYYPELQEDWTYILETLANKYPIGWTFQPYNGKEECDFVDISSCIRFLYDFKNIDGTAVEHIVVAERAIGKEVGQFIEPIVNRSLRLGIGKSLLSKSDLTPMLAKKYEGKPLTRDVYVTEKLDGNRCIAHFDDNNNKWCFTSRSGKPLNVNFDMHNCSIYRIYDGEIMSVTQTEASINRTNIFIHGEGHNAPAWRDTINGSVSFNETSGLINRKGNKTGLIYNIFDVIEDKPYEQRREYLDFMRDNGLCSSDVRIIPVLYKGRDAEVISEILDFFVSTDGEGIMLNMANRKYEHKRSDALLKYKQVQTIDMFVTGIFAGKGKYEGLCGGICCFCGTDDGKQIYCDVGSGLSDAQRIEWANNPGSIVTEIVEIAYHELTQNANTLGTNMYSLRFPRLKKLRYDKKSTSEY